MSLSKGYEQIILDLQQGSNKTIEYMQFDINSHYMEIRLTQGYEPFSVEGAEVELHVLKPDGKKSYIDSEVIDASNGIVKFKVSQQMLLVDGICRAEVIVLGKDISKLGFPGFNYIVNKSHYDAETIQSADEFKTLEKIVGQVNEKIYEMNNAVDQNIEINNQALENNIFTNNVALCEALGKIDESELIRIKGLIELLQRNKLGIEDKAADSSKLNGALDDDNAVANTIVKRNASGDIATKKLALGDNGSEIYIDASLTKCIPSFKDGITGDLMHLLTSRELQIEKGTFTPYGYGGDNAVNFTHSIQQGTYYRVGKMVTVCGRISASHFNSAAGHFRIGGLPFRIREQYSPCVLGFVSGVKLGSADIQVNAFGELAYQFIQFTFNNTNTGVGWSNVGVSKLITPLDVSFSMTYLTD